MDTATRRLWLAPEVIQTSAMDCGPASLNCLLDGFGIPVNYACLREACQTDVDGTSIGTLEQIADATYPSQSTYFVIVRPAFTFDLTFMVISLSGLADSGGT